MVLPPRHQRAGGDAALAPDGRGALAADVEGALYWTPLLPDTQSLVDHAQGLRGRPLSPVERARYFLDVEEEAG